jgi:hypothetical protein
MSNNTIDVVILSNTVDKKFFRMLERCILSIKNSIGVNTSITLVESNTTLSNKNIKKLLPIDNIIFPNKVFNYNMFLNIGVQACKNDIILISNNDVFYEKNAISILKSYLDEYDSVSPWDNNTSASLHKNRGIYEGYKVRYNVAGYSFMTKKSVIESIGGFDERFTFWYADDDYALSLQKHNFKHALIGSASVFHGFEQSHKLFDSKEKIERTYGAKKVFLNKWQK